MVLEQRQLCISIVPDADQPELQQTRRQVCAGLQATGQRATEAAQSQVRRFRPLQLGPVPAADGRMRLWLSIKIGTFTISEYRFLCYFVLYLIEITCLLSQF